MYWVISPASAGQRLNKEEFIMAKAYNILSSQGIKRHIDNVKQEIEREKAKAEMPLELDLEGGYTEQVIAQTEQHYRYTSSGRDRMKILNILLMELETKALPEALAGEHQRMIAGLEGNVARLEKQIEILHRRQTPEDLIEPVKLQMQEARAELEQARAE